MRTSIASVVCSLLPGLQSFEGGPYSSPEGLNKQWTHAFIMTFDKAASRDAYLPHPEHERVKGIVAPQLADVIAFDFEVLIDEDPDAADFVVGEIANASVEVDVAGFTDLLRSRAADAEDVGEGDLDSLFARDVDAGDTCHGGWTPQP